MLSSALPCNDLSLQQLEGIALQRSPIEKGQGVGCVCLEEAGVVDGLVDLLLREHLLRKTNRSIILQKKTF